LGRQGLCSHTESPQEPVEDLAGGEALTGIVAMQVDEKLYVRETRHELMGKRQCEGGLAPARRAGDRRDHHRPRSTLRQEGMEAGEFRLPPREEGDIGWELMQCLGSRSCNLESL